MEGKEGLRNMPCGCKELQGFFYCIKEGGKAVKKVRKGKARTVGDPGRGKGQEKGVQPGLLSYLPSLEGERVILTVPFGKGKGDEGEA